MSDGKKVAYQDAMAQAQELVKRCGLGERQVRDILEVLVKEHCWPIGAHAGKAGRWIIANEKGSKVLVEGRLKAEPTVYQRKDGTWASSYELTAESVRFLSGKDEPAVTDDVPF